LPGGTASPRFERASNDHTAAEKAHPFDLNQRERTLILIRSEIMSPLATSENSVLLHEMMASLGIDLGPEALGRLELRYPTAFRRCQACAAKGNCREWLDLAAASTSFAPRFCVNADILFELQCDQPGPRRAKS
jgi:hypothetical protein